MRMRRALLYSLLMHVAIAVLAWIDAPWRGSLSVEEERVIAVEIADISQVTERRLATPKAAPRPPKPDPAPREDVAAIPPPPPKPVDPEPELVPIPSPDQTAAAEEEPPILPARPRPKPVPPPKDDFQSVLKTVELLDRDQTENPKPQNDDTGDLLEDLAAVLDSAEEPPPQQAATLSSFATADLKEAVKRQIQPCWVMPVGARNPEELVVTLRLVLRRDGSVISVDVLNKARLRSDPFYRAAGDSARRAVQNPRCTPFDLPIDRYDVWKDMTLDFNPAKSVGR